MQDTCDAPGISQTSRYRWQRISEEFGTSELASELHEGRREDFKANLHDDGLSLLKLRKIK